MCKECEEFLFDYGKAVLGKDTGGMIVRLKQNLGISSAHQAIKMAAQKSDPREYIGAVLRGKKFDPNGAKIGEIVNGYQWTGSRWKQLEA